jgi:hypothetical protein
MQRPAHTHTFSDIDLCEDEEEGVPLRRVLVRRGVLLGSRYRLSSSSLPRRLCTGVGLRRKDAWGGTKPPAERGEREP